MGLGEGITYPAINVLLAKWASPNERFTTGSLCLNKFYKLNHIISPKKSLKNMHQILTTDHTPTPLN